MSIESVENKKILRVAIFGAGKMATHHIRAITLQENAKLVAVADPAIDQIKSTVELPSGVRVFSDPADLLENMKPDVVHICSPPGTHAKLSLLAIKHKANIYVEKPFTLHVKDAKEIISLADASGLKVCVGHQLLFEEPARIAKSSIRKIGRIVHVESYFSFNPVKESLDGRAVMSPLDQLVDILPHPVYLLLYFMKCNLPENEKEIVNIKALNVITSGNVHGIFQCRDVTGNLYVTLEGRPIESCIKVIGTNGSLFVDFVRGTSHLLAGPGTSGIAKVINPYSQSWQIQFSTTKSLTKRVLKKQKSYPGLFEIIDAYYKNLSLKVPMDFRNEDIIETVAVCEEITTILNNIEKEENSLAERERNEAELSQLQVDRERGGVLITGGTGFLGRAAAAELRGRKWPTRVVTRSIPTISKKIPGVEYMAADLGEDVPNEIFKDISVVVHCAAETAGGKEAHARNSIEATRNILEAMGKAGVKKFIHISSIAVLMTSHETGSPVDEDTPLVPDSDGRGPYVWGKVESEKLAGNMCRTLGIDIRVIRPGALVDYNDFEAPGRLGREVGPLFVCIGKRKSQIGICDVNNAAKVIRLYVEDFDNMPPALNLIEPESPKNAELVSILLKNRPDLKVLYFPRSLLWLISPGLTVAQKLLRPKQKPIDIYAVFAQEEYKNDSVTKIFQAIADEERATEA